MPFADLPGPRRAAPGQEREAGSASSPGRKSVTKLFRFGEENGTYWTLRCVHLETEPFFRWVLDSRKVLARGLPIEYNVDGGMAQVLSGIAPGLGERSRKPSLWTSTSVRMPVLRGSLPEAGP